jgi:hypothetical protein
MNVIAMLIRRPYDVAVLREEINLYCSGNEMNKSVLSKLAKLDSFIRESTRHNPLGLGLYSLLLRVPSDHNKVSTPRTARKNFTFSDGMVIPAGARIGAPIDLFHLHNPDVDNPGAFDGFRYSNMAGKSRGSSRHQAVNTDLNFLTFGHGTHTWYDRLS